MTRHKYITYILILWAILYTGIAQSAFAQTDDSEARLKEQISHYFAHYHPDDDIHWPNPPQVQSYKVDDLLRRVTVQVDATFANQTFTPTMVKKVYKKLRRSLPRPFNKYSVKVMCCGLPIEHLSAPYPDMAGMKPGQWGRINYTGKPWVDNVSRPNAITHGLYNHHLSLWASHGLFFDSNKQRWRWQRPNLFGTTEDLFTQTIVVPYLMPMLQNAGAVIFTPRERDWQTHEVIVDNDMATDKGYSEEGQKWHRAPLCGFALHSGCYQDAENPFAAGTARMTATTKRKSSSATATYQPNIPEEGRYAVYVSYQTVEGSVDDAEYTVYHKGQSTTFRVNQQMGGSTWVYLGTFDFDRGSNIYNKVVVSNQSAKRGIVTTDAVRFGGGMGNIQRGSSISNMPRCLEGARYWAQWAGAPKSVYYLREGGDDYADDLNSRSLMTNWLGGGSVYMPALEGKGVPIELNLALHSDAGYDEFGGDALTGSLAVCTTRFNDGRLNSGVSRMLSRDFADSLLNNTYRDIHFAYRRWAKRYLWDRNYSETRCPEVPSAILEMLSHQNFNDMKMGQDPNFKFTLARSIYKTILRFINTQHGQPCIVQPLPPTHFSVNMREQGTITLSWTPTIDRQEPTAMPTSYKLYTAAGSADFDNGTLVNTTHYTFKPEPGVTYRFKVAAVNRGGESFTTETLAALYNPTATKTLRIVNGFHRLAAPAIVNNVGEEGFDFNADMGVQRDIYAGWNGAQTCFDKRRMGKEGPGGLGYGGDEWAGKFIMGNTFNFVTEHAEAIGNNTCNIVSCSADAVIDGQVKLSDTDAIDLILGLEKNDGHSLIVYNALPIALQRKLTEYLRNGGRLMMSGAYIGEDMTKEQDKAWLADLLKVSYEPTDNIQQGKLNGLGMEFDIYRTPNDKHYATQHPNVLAPLSPAYCAMQYADGTSAAVAYDGADYKCIVAGFPFECITDKGLQAKLMNGMLRFILK